jgi:hypothetical protein
MIATFRDSDGDLYAVETFGNGSGAVIDLRIDNRDVITFYASDAGEIIKLIQQAAEAAA